MHNTRFKASWVEGGAHCQDLPWAPNTIAQALCIQSKVVEKCDSVRWLVGEGILKNELVCVCENE
jgi:hypothetical protein